MKHKGNKGAMALTLRCWPARAALSRSNGFRQRTEKRRNGERRTRSLAAARSDYLDAHMGAGASVRSTSASAGKKYNV